MTAVELPANSNQRQGLEQDPPPASSSPAGAGGASLAVLERAERMLADVATAEDAASLVDYAEAARVYAQRAKLGTASVNHATAIKLKAERRLADIVDEGQAKGEIATKQTGGALGGRPTNHVRTTDKVSVQDQPSTLEDLGIDRRRLDESRKIRDRYTDAEIDEVITDATQADETVARRDFIKGQAHVRHNSGVNEWYTPGPYLEAARAVLERFDLDPASSDLAQQSVQAERYFTAESDGLASDWGAAERVWMNPPYAQPLIGRFIDRFTAHCSRHGAGIALVNNATDTAWGAELLGASDAVCFPTGRIRFLDPDGNPGGAPLQGQMIALVTKRVMPSELDGYVFSFRHIFSEFGPVMVRG